MAAYEIKRIHETSFCVFSIDSEADLSDLPTTVSKGRNGVRLSPPCSMGSKAYTIDGVKYVLGGDNVWKQQT